MAKKKAEVRVKMLVAQVGDYWERRPGEVWTVPADEAARLFAAGYAVPAGSGRDEPILAADSVSIDAGCIAACVVV